MSRSDNSIVKLIAALGVCGLMMVLWTPRVNAQVTSFSEANYSGRYGCLVASDDDFFTAIIKYTPNGAGGYTDGTLVGSLNAFTAFTPGSAASQFCTYILETGLSAYTVDQSGLGFETLSWAPSATNDASCPAAFIDESAIALRNLISSTTGASIRAQIADGNLFAEDEAGQGACLQ